MPEEKGLIALRARAISIITLLRHATKTMQPPMTASIIALYGKNPFLILISCLLSLRTRDTTTLPASIRLFEHAQSPEELVNISIPTLEKLIYPVGFYHKKARQIKAVSYDLIDRFASVVPNTLQELLSIRGVGHKTANLVLGEAFGIPSLCVDTHVHRIANRLGLVQTTNPLRTEYALKQILPQEYWIEFNRLLVIWGQNVCVPLAPFCSKCVIYDLCERKNVSKKR